MAARNPSSFTIWFDEDALLPGKNIIETVPDQILDGAEEMFDQAELLVSWQGRPFRTTEIDPGGDTWTGAMELVRLHMEAIDMCDEDGATGTHKALCAARVWCDGTATASLRFQSLVGGDEATASISNTSPAWVAIAGSLGLSSNNVQEDIQLDLRLDTGYTYAYCNGIVVWMPHQ